MNAGGLTHLAELRNGQWILKTYGGALGAKLKIVYTNDRWRAKRYTEKGLARFIGRARGFQIKAVLA